MTDTKKEAEEIAEKYYTHGDSVVWLINGGQIVVEKAIERGISLGRAEIVAKVREFAKDALEHSTTMVDRDGYGDRVISLAWIDVALTRIIEGEGK
jgi:uncharacterized protein YlzI (FlbEa/FlbD family)